MKHIFLALFILSVFVIACSKQNGNSTLQSNAFVSNNDVTANDTVKIPLIDLGTGTYFGHIGGLYPDGSNYPSGQYDQDLYNACSSITTLDANGNYSATGKVGFISIGASTCSIMMNNLRKKTKQNKATNPNLLMANCTGGGESVQEINDTISGAYWATVNRKLAQNALAAKQVEVIYMETDDSINNMTFPARPLNTKNEYEKTMRIFKIKFPNIKIVYLTGRTTTFLGTGNKKQNREPGPYYNGWGCKYVIEDVINNFPGTEYKGDDAVAPIVAWGWYEWSIGNVPRTTDGFLWTNSLTKDGLHANDAGADTLSTRFMNWLLNDPHSNIWYAKH